MSMREGAQEASIIDDMLRELEQEAATTRRLLERVPDDQLGWKPHPKARTLGELALHVAVVPGGVAQFASTPGPVQAPQFSSGPSPQSADELVPALEKSVAEAREALGGMDERTLQSDFRMMHEGREIFSIPRVAFLRSVMLNHWYHHRGQLTVYLRQLGVPIPSIYGASADENPFA